ncbi:MAG: hypothetical protein BWY69_01331 [Planctomycetes bacterium ADurb.Bin401]|nr:MAG: hypothetical protein BWY69_01331 [Planctomycetes bacterium ADurb.Bin401]
MINNRQTELSSLVRDNIDEILVRIIQFTNIHHNLISENIRGYRAAGFVPMFIDVEDFAKVISIALTEHQKTKRLALCDSRTVTFLKDGEFAVEPQVDFEAADLMCKDLPGYLDLQKSRLRENIANNKAACALFYHKLNEMTNQVTDDPVENQI